MVIEPVGNSGGPIPVEGAVIRAGVDPGLLDDVSWWRTDDLSFWALEALMSQ